MANQAGPRRRFAPVPIETTFEQYRKIGPAPELTPSPSPRSASPPPREKRKFAPQLVESSVRRSRRAGDDGPATKPTDRTDITPYTNHIYAPKSRWRQGQSRTREPLTRRESCDDEVAGPVFDLVAKDAQRKLQEVALSAFPNSSVRTGGAEHFYVREGSEDDNVHARGREPTRGPGRVRRSRRNSSTEDISWAFKEMQEHAAILEIKRDRISTPELDRMSIDGPPSDAMNLTRAQRQSLSNSPLWIGSRSSSLLGSIGEHHLGYVRAESPLPTIGESAMPYMPPDSPPAIRPIGESFMPYIPSAPPGQAANMPYVPASQIPAETGFGSSRATPAPFSGFRNERDMSLERLRNLHRIRATASPPMLGQDITFRMCPSPKQTKLEPDHLWDLQKGTTAEEPNRDATGEHGLWRGYCYTSDESEKLVLAERPAMISTPYPPATPGDPFAKAFSLSEPLSVVCGEPEETETVAKMERLHVHSRNLSTSATLQPEHRTHSREPKGLHMLQGLEERLRKEKAAADLEEKIVEEFDDTFVTQVYNYLSLGYPAMARAYDEELSKISRISIQELEKDDDVLMDGHWSYHGVGCDGTDGADIYNGKKGKATGHIMIGSEEKHGIGEEDRTPRWKALKQYIYEWARQHPDLSAISPLAWGMQERRGSWGL